MAGIAPSVAGLPAVKVGEAPLLSPGAADSYYGTSTIHTNDLGWTRPVELKELARALRYDVDLIYEFVRNKVGITPLYGL